MVVLIYLTSIVAANLIAARFGPSATVINAFVLIGLDLTLRDRLHDAWRGHGLVWKMALLILVGGALSVLVNRDALLIAIASCAAFMSATTVDAIGYTLLEKRGRAVRVNGSNVASAAVDSAVFIVIAFGWPPLWGIVLAQWAVKVAGGAVWYVILTRSFVGVQANATRAHRG
jgi:queuosine precursor transporter